MSSQVSVSGLDSGRRALNARQVETVDRLVGAALAEVRAVGYDALTVRSVAARAAVAPATAYTYFASKNHLIAETFWRELQGLPQPSETEGDVVDRVSALFLELAAFLAREPELASATTVALLGSEPDVGRLRLHVGAGISDRIRDAIGRGADEVLLEALTLAWSGSMLQAGLGLQSYAAMGDQLVRVTRLMIGGRR